MNLNKKKNQSSLEFILILTFLMVIFTILLKYLGGVVIELQKYQTKKYIDDFMSSIENEIRILNSVNEGYYREKRIPYDFLESYNISIIDKTFIIIDKYNNISYYYYYSYEGNVSIINKTTTINGITGNFYFFIFQK